MRTTFVAPIKTHADLSRKTRLFNFVRRMFKACFIEGVLVRKTQGRSPNFWICKVVPNYYQYDHGSTRYVVRDGIFYKLDISDILDWYLYYGFEEIAHRRLYELCEEGEIVLDVGAGIGRITLNCARRVGSRGFVYAFEPDPINYEKCLANFKLNGFKNIKLFRAALTCKPGYYEMCVVDEHNRGRNTIVNDGPGEMLRSDIVGIPGEPLDEIRKREGVERVDVMKVDVEGYELNVLRGGSKTLEEFRPKLFIEVHDDNLRRQGTSAKELISWLEQFDYHVTHAETGVTVTSSSEFRGCHFDVVALPCLHRCRI